MSKWINDRAWTVSMYICYALCFIILSVAGYNYTMSIIGETSSIMHYLVCGIWCIYGILNLHNTPERTFKSVVVVFVPPEDEKGHLSKHRCYGRRY